MSSPVRTLAEFIELAKKNPGKLNAGAGGGGQRVPVALFLQQNNLHVQIVPYNGTGPTITAMLSGEVDFTILSPGPLATVASSPRIRLLATTGDVRSSTFPGVPTTTEAGMPDFHVADFFTVYVRRGTSPEITEKLNTALNDVAARPEVAAKFRALGFTIVRRTAEQASENYGKQVAWWKDIVARTQIPPLD